MSVAITPAWAPTGTTSVETVYVVVTVWFGPAGPAARPATPPDEVAGLIAHPPASMPVARSVQPNETMTVWLVQVEAKYGAPSCVRASTVITGGSVSTTKLPVTMPEKLPARSSTNVRT